MDQTPKPVPPARPPRPRWVYGLGLVLALLVVGAIIFAIALHSAGEAAPDEAAPPIVTPESAPSDGKS